MQTPSALDNGFRVEDYDPQFLTVDLGRQCTETCAHCVVEARPRRREKAESNDVAEAIYDASTLGFDSVSFYGGEPFANRRVLYPAISDAYEHSNMVPQVMTNGFWGKTRPMARRFFSEVQNIIPSRDRRRLQVNMSTDVYHVGTPLESIANIITEWLDMDLQIDLNLAIGGPVKDEEIFDQIASLVNAKTGFITTSPALNRFDRSTTVHFIRETFVIQEDTSLELFVDELRRRNAFEEDKIDVLRNQKSFMEAVFVADANGWLHFVQTPEHAAKHSVEVGIPHAKKLGISFYSILLTGAGEALLMDPELRKLVSRHRNSTDPNQRRHEHESNIILGSDNHYYVHPTQLNLRAGSLGEHNFGRHDSPIGHAVSLVRRGHPIAKVLLQGDTSSVIDAARLSTNRFFTALLQQLTVEGLGYEAIAMGLRNEEVLKRLLGNFI